MHVIANSKLEVSYLPDAGTLTVSALPDRGRVISGGELTQAGGQANVTSVSDPIFGQGKAIEVTYPDGSGDRAMLYDDLDFVLFQPVFRNTTAADVIVDTVKPFRAVFESRAEFAHLRALGTAGLTAPDKHDGSYVFLAIADPATRSGLVGAWLTHDRGSGIVLSGRDGDKASIEARLEYGRLPVKPGQTAVGEIFALGWFEDARLGLESWADLVAKHYQIRLPKQPSGYCTWYCSPHGGASDEKHVVEIAEFAARELKPFGLDFVQIDDFWQDGKRRNGPAKVFGRHNPTGPYPNGMKGPAEKIRALGLTPGLWFIPFAGDHEDPFFADKQYLFAKGPDGKPYAATWGGTCLDLTHPDTRAYLKEVIGRIAHDWGYTYFKMDGLWTGTATKLLYVNNGYKPDDLGKQTLHDPATTQIEAYRSGLKLVRDTAGADTFLLGCCVPQNMRSFGASFGLVDAMRIGPDNGVAFDALKRGPWHGTNRYFLHGRIWYNDPDPVYVRPNMPLAHSQLICSWVALTGQFNVSSDWYPTLPPERLDILKRTLPSHDLHPRPVDLFEADLARIWLLTETRDGVRRDVVGLFNWQEAKSASIEVAADRLGLPEADSYVGFDYWNDRFVPPFSGTLRADLAPGSCRILALRAAADHPLVVSTSRHITQGVVDLTAENWNAPAGELTGTSTLVAGDPCELRIVVPVGATSWRAVEARLADAAQGRISVKQDGPKVRARIEPATTGPIAWTIRFEREAVAAPEVRPVSDLSTEVAYTHVKLTWNCSSADGFVIQRSGGAGPCTIRTGQPSLVDTDVEHGTTYRYAVQARYWDGRLSEPVTVEAATEKELTCPPFPPPPAVHLSDLTPVEARTGWGQVRKDQSCQGNPLTLDGKVYDRGMGVHADSALVYDIPAGSRRFVSVIGVDDEVRKDPRPSVVFRVYGDVREMGEEPVLLGESPLLCRDTIRTWCLDLELSDRLKRLKLVVTAAGDGIACDHADWANAGFVK